MQSYRSQCSWDAAQADLVRHRAAGLKGTDLFEAVASDSLQRKVAANTHRCQRCWHDKQLQCICDQLPLFSTTLPVRILVLMHYREFLSAGDDAKLILAMLPSQAKSYIFGRKGAVEELVAEMALDPRHTLILWPGSGALTVEEWHAARPGALAGWGVARTDSPPSDAATRPLQRVVVLDGVYTHARHMFRALRAALAARTLSIAHVALHPRSLSLYHRAHGGYAKASQAAVERSADPLALRICTLEAVALLLQELGEPSCTTAILLQALLANNHALEQHPARTRAVEGRLPPSLKSGRSPGDVLAFGIRLVDSTAPEISACRVEVTLAVLCQP